MLNSLSTYVNICDNLLSLYQSSFGIDLSRYDIKCDTLDMYAPITRHFQKSVVLNCDINCPSQIAFQLSHELCHVAVSRDVKNNLRWFEEVLAVLASRIFPLVLSDIKNEKYISYFDSALAMCPPKCVSDSSTILDQKILTTLESGSGTSNYNDYGSYWNVAQKLLPVIDFSSDIWQCIHYLSDVPYNLSFSESLDEWSAASPSNVRNSISIIKSTLLLR